MPLQTPLNSLLFLMRLPGAAGPSIHAGARDAQRFAGGQAQREQKQLGDVAANAARRGAALLHLREAAQHGASYQHGGGAGLAGAQREAATGDAFAQEKKTNRKSARPSMLNRKR